MSGITPADGAAAVLMLGFWIAMGVVIWSDATRYIIPDTVSILLTIGGAAAWALATGSGAVVALHLAVGLGMAVAVCWLFFVGQWSGGDVKLLAATSVWLDFKFLAGYVLLASAAGGVLTLAILILRRWRPDQRRPWPWLVNLCNPAEGLPYGIALAIAGLAVSGPVFQESFGWTPPVIGAWTLRFLFP